MKNHLKINNIVKTLIIMGVLTIFSFIHTETVNAYGYDWDITSFNTDITAHKDGSMLIKETIVADYSREKHHGIYRTIPVVYGDATYHKLKLRYKVLSVKDENGKNWWYETSRSGDYLKIKAGDKNTYQTKPTTFVITYEIQRAISFQFDDHDEIYWNATGDEWEVPINNATATIHFPQEISEKDIRTTCFTGNYGSSEKACESQIDKNTVHFKSTRPLNEYEGLTIVTGFPKNIIQKPDLIQNIIWFLEDNWAYLLPVLTFIILFYIWYTRGRDPRTNRDTIMPHYKAPKDISPAEAGTIIDETVDMHDISAAIINLAVKGYIKIIEKKKKNWIGSSSTYTFEKLKNVENDSSLHKHEKIILDTIFGSAKIKKLEDLKYKFYKKLPNIKQEIYKDPNLSRNLINSSRSNNSRIFKIHAGKNKKRSRNVLHNSRTGRVYLYS